MIFHCIIEDLMIIYLQTFFILSTFNINIFQVKIELSLYFSLKLCYNVKNFYIFVEGRFIMKANYTKLWHILLDRNMKKKELADLAGVSTYTINKLNKNENVTVEVLGKICKALDCSLDDIMEFEDKE